VKYQFSRLSDQHRERSGLDQLWREKLLELLKQLLTPVAEVERLRQPVEELEAEIERLKNQSAYRLRPEVCLALVEGINDN
jgi:cell division protein FtsB